MHLTDCNNCKKKEFSLKQGNLCSLTHEKPNFEGACPDYEPLPESETYRPLADSYEKEEVSGWLAFFLWVGLGGGSLLTLFNILPALGLYSTAVSSLFCLMGFCVVVTAIAAIYAFYKRLPNAVYLAMTYIVMVIVDGVGTLIIGEMFGVSDSQIAAIRSLGWGGIWMTYLLCSSKVRAIIPPTSRKWCLFEKLIFCVFVTSLTSIILLLNSAFKGDVEMSEVYDNKSVLEESVRYANRQCPMSIGDGVWMLSQKIEGDEYIIKCSIDQDKDLFSGVDWDLVAEQVRIDMLANTYWVDEDQTVKMAFDAGYALTYEYVDINHKPLYSVTFHASDFE